MYFLKLRKIFTLGVGIYFLSLPCLGQEIHTLLKDFEAYAEKAMKDWKAVGLSIAIVKDEKIIFTKGFGQRSLEDKRPVTEDTLFQIGSIAKAFTTTLSGIAVDKGWFKWEDPVIEHFPEFLLYDSWVTRQFRMDDLYAQRSGLIEHAGDGQVFLGIPEEKIISNLRFFKPVSSFRSQFSYLNIPFLVGAHILERKSGKKWVTLLEEDVFNPLGMTNSSASLNAYLNADNRAGWHFRKRDGTAVQVSDDFDAANWVYLYGPAGGINSSAKEMANWLILQTNQGVFQGKQILSKESFERITRPYIYVGENFGAPNFYCLGWILREYAPYPIIWHDGGTTGVTTCLAFIPQNKLGIVVLCNMRETLVAEALTLQFFDMYYEKKEKDWSTALLDFQNTHYPLIKEKKPQSIPPLPLQQYTGVYTNEVYGDAKVSIDEDSLIIEIGPKPTFWKLKHENRDAFYFNWFIEEEPISVFFCFDADNKPITMTIEVFERGGNGIFRRSHRQER